MITTTLNRIRAHGPCEDGWRKLLAGLGKTAADDEPLPFARIVEINGLDDALWCCRAEPQHAREWRLFAVWCARQVQHLMPDSRGIAVMGVADGVYAAWEAARTVAWAAAQAAGAVVWDAAAAGCDARAAVRDTTWGAQKARFLEVVS